MASVQGLHFIIFVSESKVNQLKSFSQFDLKDSDTVFGVFDSVAWLPDVDGPAVSGFCFLFLDKDDVKPNFSNPAIVMLEAALRIRASFPLAKPSQLCQWKYGMGTWLACHFIN